jgi:hypothetical protein
MAIKDPAEVAQAHAVAAVAEEMDADSDIEVNINEVFQVEKLIAKRVKGSKTQYKGCCKFYD